MATSAVYTLLEMAERDTTTDANDDVDEGEFEIGGRKTWDLELVVGHLGSGDDVQVVVETSPNGEDDTWSTLHDFGTVNSSGTTDASNKTVPDEHLYGVMKARVASVTGTAWVECRATSPFLDPASAGDKNLLSKSVREFGDGLTRLVERAEQDVIEHAIGTTDLGKLEANLTKKTSRDRVRRAIARQAEHLLAKHRLERSSETEDIQAAVSHPELADGLDVLLNPILDDSGLMVWRGRR